MCASFSEPPPSLLAVDVGLSTGLALYGGDGRLRWYRSQHFANHAALRQGVFRLLRELRDVERICLEGGGPLADIWERAGQRRGIDVSRIAAETWRARLLYAREQRNGAQAKQKAEDLARRIIAWSGAPGPTALRHDAAEAILVGLWAVLELGWLAALPAALRR